MRLAFVTGFAVLCATPSSLCAQEAPANNGALLIDEVLSCRAVVPASERLACFDKAVSPLGKARDQRTIVVTDRASLHKSRRALFGIPLPDMKLFSGDEDEPEVTAVDATITSVRSDNQGAYVLGLDDGSVWRLSEPPRGGDPEKGEKIHIKRGTLGSYFGSVSGHVSVRMQRTR